MNDAPALSIAALNAAPLPEAAAMLAPLVERSPWLAERVAALRPFADAAALGGALETVIRGLGPAEALVLLRAHPELAPPSPEAMTAASQGEQGRLGLARPAPEIAARLADLNRRYAARFGHPFIVALHRMADLDAVFAQFEGRLTNPPEVERALALGEVVSVVRARLALMARPAALGAR